MFATSLILAAAVANMQPAAHRLEEKGRPAPRCVSRQITPAADNGRMTARRLGDLPKARAEAAVDRRVDGCPVPVFVRFGPTRH
jgi:hypothetical protein